MAATLLAHLYTHIKGSQEDIATLALQHIVSESKELNRAYTRLLSTVLYVEIDEDLNYICQATGENKERPDIAGINMYGKEEILCEAKFYAGLTQNQPNTYIDRLSSNKGIGLVFICPSSRKHALWNKLLELVAHRDTEKIADFCVSVDQIHMAITTWSEVLDVLRLTASSVAISSISDIEQLSGFCKLMDEEAFIPYSSEDFGPEHARREQRHYEVLDAVFNKLIVDKELHANTKGLKATTYKNGYVRYLRVLRYTLAINYDRKLWRETTSAETPFWVTITAGNWKQPQSYREILNKYPEYWKTLNNGCVTLALFAPTDSTLDEVAENLYRQIISYIQDLENTTEIEKE